MKRRTVQFPLAALAAALWFLALAPVAVPADTYDGRTLAAVTASCPEDVKALYDVGADIEGRRGDVYRALLTDAQMDALKTAGLGVEVLAEEMARDRALFANPGYCTNTAWPCYWAASKFNTTNPANGTLMKHLLDLYAAHPDICRLYDIGNSADGAYDIIAMQVSLNPDVAQPEPKIRIYGNIHGDEVCGLMVACDALDWILANYATDPRAQSLVNGADLWFIPMGNPWGNANKSRYNKSPNGKDLNRNFSGPAGCDAPPCFSEPETQAIRDLTEVMGKRFALSLSFHGGAICFNSLWNYTYNAPADEPIFWSARTPGSGCSDENGCLTLAPDGLAKAYQDGCTTPGFWYTNGADWYITRGDTNDWSYSVWSDLDTTVEVSNTKWPDSSQIPALVNEHRQATINYMLKVFQGISGVVLDAGTGAPLAATVKVTATASPSVPVPHAYKDVFTDPAVGDYHRILEPGTYSVTCTAPGYISQTVPGVVVSADTTATVHFNLGTTAVSVVATASPTAGVAPLAVAFGSSVSGGTGPYSYLWAFGDGGTSTEQNPSHTYAAPGTYHPSVTVTDALGAAATDAHLAVTVTAAPCTLSCTAAAPSSAVAGDTVSFSASAQVQNCAGTVAYTWDFGDGATSSQKNPGHTYAAPGTYSWTLQARVADALCTKSGSLVVEPPCTVSCEATAAPDSGAAPLAVQFSGVASPDHCSGNPTFAWSFGDGSASSLLAPQHTYPVPGTYLWKFTVSVDGKSCSREGTTTVSAPCTLDCAASATPAGEAQPFLVRFAASAIPQDCAGQPSFAWDFGDGASSSEASPEHLYPGAGSYAWSLTVRVGNATCAKSGTVTLSAPCTLACEASASPAAGAVPLAVAFSASALPDHCDGAPGFVWTFGDGESSAQPDTVHTYGAAGTYAWTLTATAGGVSCVRTGTVAVVEPACTLTCEASAAPASGQSPLVVGFSASASAAHCDGVPTYAWAFGDGGTSTEREPVHTYLRAGTYAWALTVTQGGESCTRTGTVTAEAGLPGDGDGDGTVSIGEVQQAINMFLGIQVPGNGVDCNGDGAVSIGEVQRVINAFLGIPASC